MRDNWSAMKRLIYLRGNPATGGGSPEVDLTVTGTLPLSLPNASALPLISLTQYGKSELLDTPAPDAPASIMCNRGLLIFTDNELPEGYARITGMTLNGDTYWEIPIHLYGYDTVRFSISVTAACNVFGCYTTTSATNNYSLYISSTSGSKYLRYNGGTYKSYWSSSAMGQRYDITISPYGSEGMPSGQDDTWNETEFESDVNMCIGTTSVDATSSKFKGNFYGEFLVDGKFYGIPCEREEDGAIGWFDAYSYEFYAPVGSNPVSLGYDTSSRSQGVDNGQYLKINNGSNHTFNQNLFSVGNVCDEFEHVSGAMTRRIVQKILDGSETFSTSSTYGATVYISSAASSWSADKTCTPVCTHFEGIAPVSSGTQNDATLFFDSSGNLYFRTSMNASEFKEWLTREYAFGHPVRILLVNSSPSQSGYTGWAVNLEKGSNTISGYDSEFGVQYKAVYKGKG